MTTTRSTSAPSHLGYTRVTVAAIVAVLFAGGVALGCGADDGDNGGAAGEGVNGDNGGATGEGVSLTYIPQVLEPINSAISCGVVRRAEELGADVTVEIPGSFDAGAQTRVVSAVLARNPDQLLIAPSDATAMSAPVLQASQSGIQVGTVLTELAESGVAPHYASSDYVEWGRVAAREMAEMLEGQEGPVAMLEFTPGQSSVPDDEAEGFEDEIAEFENLEYIGSEVVEFEPRSSTERMNALLAREPDLLGVFTTYPGSAVGAATAIRQRQAAGDVVHIAAGVDEAVLTALGNGAVDATVNTDFARMGELAAEAIIQAEGEAQTETELTPPFTITSENVDDPTVAATLTVGDECPE